ncbi:hypothetical protein HANVADRAFT_4284 [Hanseniaspora valbyensis NRRL Y-1626]|uniref:Uncharacterized protein n=1 Tax=Hanseniaspora valbyensis NRRL Y-1626 TaxID=766949 RepID=A0A1B7T857_9ASCO|nr:hypothetical protein HANVADRAFT_4284 [Hanseniaspora valbyensis NRRL Y-1626]
MADINKVLPGDLNIYTRLLDYINNEDESTNPSSTVISSNDKKYLIRNNKNDNLISKLTTSVVNIKDNTSAENISKELSNINENVLQLKIDEPINSSANLMILLKSLPWDDSRLTLLIIEQLFKNLSFLTGVELYYEVFQKLKMKKLGVNNKELDIDDFRGNLQIDSLNLIENLRLLYAIKGKEFWSICMILAMKEIKLFDTVEELQKLIYWVDNSETSYLDTLLAKIDDKKLSEEELIVYCQALMFRGWKEDYHNIIKLINKDIDEKSGNINLYLKNIVIEACEHLEDNEQLFTIAQKLLKSLNDYKVLLKYVNVYETLHEDASKQDIVKLLDTEFNHFIETRNFRLIKVYLDHKFDNQFTSLKNYLDIFNNKLACIPDLKNLVPKDVLVDALNLYEPSSTRDFNIYQLTEKRENLPNIEDSSDYQENEIDEKLNNNKILLSAEDYVNIINKLDTLSRTYPEAFQFNLLKIVIYNNLTLNEKALKVYDDLSIKNLQKLSLDSLINNVIPEPSPNNEFNVMNEISNFGYILSLTLEKETYSKFANLVKFSLDISNSNVSLFKLLKAIKKQRFFGNKQYKTILNNLINTLLKFDIKNTKDDSLVLPYNLVNQWDYSSNDKELWYSLLNEFYILKSLDGGSLKYERIIDLIKNEKLPSDYESSENLLVWQSQFFKEYSDISNDNEKILTFLNDQDISLLITKYTQELDTIQPWQILSTYVVILETFKTLDSIKKFQTNKSLKNIIKPILKKIRDENIKFIEVYSAYFEAIEDIEIKKIIDTNKKLIKSL